MKIISIHQPLFLPHWPYLEKMYYSDLFVFLTTCQYEKNSFLNRNQSWGEWITKPVNSGNIPIHDKTYTDGQNLLDVNLSVIEAFRKMFNIRTKVAFDLPSSLTKTERILEICKQNDADAYLASHDAPEKYLDIELLSKNKIQFIPFKSSYTKPTLEMLQENGIEGCMKILASGKKRFDTQYRSKNSVSE